MNFKLLFSTTFFLITFLGFPTSSFAATQNWRDRASNDDEMTTGQVGAEVEFGRQIAARILGRYKAYDNPELVKYVNLVGHSLTINTSRPELDFHFAILDIEEINAFAAPGGYVFITVGALRLMKDESELAGVLAHEISHITEMHVTKHLKVKEADDSVTSGLSQLIRGGSESAKVAFAQAIDQGVEMIFKDEYKREDELQADKIAVVLSTLSGYDPSYLAKYLDHARAVKGEITDNGQSHPSFGIRIAQINEVIAKENLTSLNFTSNQKRFDAALAGLKIASIEKNH